MADNDNRDSDVPSGGENSRGPKKNLSNVLAAATNRDLLRELWDQTKPADEFGKPLPRGEYVTHVEKGELFKARTKGTAGYKLTFGVAEGPHAGKKIWLDIWLTQKNLGNAKRDLGKLGVTSLNQLNHPLPPGIRCLVKLVLRKDDDGIEHNEVRSFEVVGIDAPEPNPFAPTTAAPPESAPGAGLASIEKQTDDGIGGDL